MIKPVNPKRNQSLIFIERTDAEFEAPILSLPDANSGLIGKHSDAGKNWEEGDWGRDGLMATWLNGYEFEQALGDGEGQESVMCCSP